MNVAGGNVQIFTAPVSKVVSGGEYHGNVQYGDRVSIQRVGLAESPQALVWRERGLQGAGPRPVEAETRPCSTCGLPVELNDLFCQACGNELAKLEAA